MSKNCQLILMLGTISLTSNLAFATTFLGATTISKKSYTDSITAHGSFNGSYLKLQSITVNGTLKLNNSSIDGALEVKG